jgi:hypothetical protein
MEETLHCRVVREWKKKWVEKNFAFLMLGIDRYRYTPSVHE